MAWIGLAEGRDGSGGRVGDGGPLRRGTLLVEARSGDEGMANLLRHAVRDPSPAGLTIRLGGGAVEVLLARDGTALAHRLPLPPLRPGEALRIALTWDEPLGVLSAWLPGRGRLLAAPALGPAPPLRAVPAGRSLGAGTAWAALADAWMPAGPVPLLPGDAPVSTPDGPRPLASLRAGDVALGPDGRAVPVLWAGAADWPALGSLAPVRLAAPWFGLSRDLVVGAEQGLVVRGSEVEYLFGVEEAVVPAGAIGAAVAGPPVRRWHGLATADGAAVLVAGAAMATIDASALGAEPVACAASVLAGTAPPAPVPARLAPPRLTPFEAAALMRARVAA